MTVSGVVLVLLAQGAQLPPGYVLDPPPCPEGKSECKPWERYQAQRAEQEKLGPGPHTLVISDRDGMTRIDYPTGEKCSRARDAIRLQTAPPPNTANIIYGPSSVKAFCVPR